MLEIKTREIVVVGWGQYDDITGLHEYQMEGERADLALLWELMEYHQGHSGLVAKDLYRLKLDITMGDTSGKGHRESYISGLYDHMMTQYPTGYNPFKPTNRW